MALAQRVQELNRYRSDFFGRLRQVLLNLTGNAVKFTHAGEVAVSVHFEPDADPGPVIHLAVRDTGIGIAPDKHATIFEPFSQEDGSTTRRFGGTGLGLTITRRLAELMGGEAGASSTTGVGSTFWFTAWLDVGQASVADEPLRPLHVREGDGHVLRLLLPQQCEQGRLHGDVHVGAR